MPKKKKKSRDNGPPPAASVPPSPQVSVTAAASPALRKPSTKSPASKKGYTKPWDTSSPPSTVDMLPLKLVLSSSSPLRSTLKFNPIVVLCDSDASRLDVASGDCVFLVSTTQSSAAMQVTKTAYAKVKVIAATGKAIGHASPRSQGAAQKKIAVGTCNIFPKYLAEAMLPPSDEFVAPSTPSAATSPATTPNTPPSKSSSRFSFAKGGGGDAIISPSSVNVTAKKTNAYQIWIVPRESAQGDVLADLLLSSAAARVHVDDAMHSNMSAAIKHQMFLAYTHGSCLAQGYALRLTLNGRQWQCTVASDELKPNADVSTIEKQFSKMSLDVGGSALLAALRDAMQDSCVARKLRLLQITKSTKFTFESSTNAKSSRRNQSAPSTLATVAGLDATLEKISTVLSQPLFHAHLFQEPLRPPRGALLCGSSGTGKTSLARQIVRDFQAQNVHVEFINCTSIQSATGHMGQAEQKVAQLFRAAETPRPGCVGGLIVLDDIHLICPRRNGMNAGADRLTSTILALLDGTDSKEQRSASNHNVVVLGITANPNALDAAVRRPGRLDVEIEVPLPDEPSHRRDILQLHVRSMPQIECNYTDPEWFALAALGKGFTGADCMLAVKEAVRNAVLRQQEECKDDSARTTNGEGRIIVRCNYQDMEKGIRRTKPSAIKSISVEVPQVHWSAIGGMEQVKKELREAIELPMTHGALFRRWNIAAPRGVLLYGPPGCSKTLMARALATEGQMNFLAVKGPELLSKWLGESERALASLFRRARMASPAVIFFDEIDAIASKRGGVGSDRLLSQLLTEMDGVQRQARVVVVAATNRPDLLDSALMRPGRMDRKIYVGAPDARSRVEIFRVGLRGKSCADGIDVEALAQHERSQGLSGAEIISVCRNAALLALEQHHEGEDDDPRISMRHLLTALDDIDGQITPEMIAFYDGYRQQN